MILFPSMIWRSLLILILSAVPALLFAQNDSWEMQRVLRNYRSALGDRAIIMQINSIGLHGTLEQAGEQCEFQLYQRSNGQIRYLLDTEQLTVVQVFDGEDGWRWVEDHPELGATRLTPEQLRFFRLFHSKEPPLQFYGAFGYELSFLGLEKPESDAEAEYHFRLYHRSDGSVIDVWLDASRYTETRRWYRPSADATPLKFEFDNYRRHQGMIIPFKVITRFDGEVISSAQVTKVQTDAGLLSFFFTKPTTYPEVETEPATDQ